jgi:Cu-Zn family superoxide dismutase
MRGLLASVVFALAAVATTGPAAAQPGASAVMTTSAGTSAGSVTLVTDGGKVRVRAELTRLPPGFHGFHVHAVGSCAAPTFMSAGGHLNPAGAAHPSHAGDMPVVHVNADGTASIELTTDRFRVPDLFDADGSAIIVHANPDNYANIPRDRYDPDPDAMTLATGDAGGRLACGVIAPTSPPTAARPRTPEARAILGSSGTVELSEEGGKVVVRAELAQLPPGFHGFHVHAVGRCDPPTYMSAEGHLNPAGASHPAHAGDMPLAHVNADGKASLSFATDRFRLADLFDADGSAIIVHANPDNYANIPADRYDPDPDAMTLATGDAGGRIACGVLRKIEACQITVSPKRIVAGERARVRATVRGRASGGRLEGIIVRYRGAGVRKTAVTNQFGRVALRVRPSGAGTLRVIAEAGAASRACRASVRVIARKRGAVQPGARLTGSR